MTSPMFGIPVGMRFAEEDLARNALVGAKIQHMAVEEAMAPFKAEHLLADASWKVHRAQTEGLDRQVEQEIANRVWMDPNLAPDMGNFGEVAAHHALRLGQAGKAADFLSKGSLVVSRDERAATEQERQRLIRARTDALHKQALAGAVRSARSPEDLGRIIRSHAERTGQGAELLNDEGELHPNFVPRWQELRDRLQLEALNESQRLLHEHRQNWLKLMDEMHELRKEQARVTNEAARERKLEKEGGGADQRAVQKDVQGLAENLLKSRFRLEGPAAAIRGRELADHATRLMEGRPALSRLQAVEEAFVELFKAGKYTGLTVIPQKQPDQRFPLPLPTRRNPISGYPYASDLIAGQYYEWEHGIRKWDGKKWSPYLDPRGEPAKQEVTGGIRDAEGGAPKPAPPSPGAAAKPIPKEAIALPSRPDPSLLVVGQLYYDPNTGKTATWYGPTWGWTKPSKAQEEAQGTTARGRIKW